MTLMDLVPWRSDRKSIPVRREDEHPFASLQRDINRIFEDFSRGFGFSRISPFGEDRLFSFQPQVDVVEEDDQFVVTAELPGVEEKDIDISVSQGALTIKGEKKVEKREEEKDRHYYERSYGFFQRTVPLLTEIDESKVSAELKKGVLRVTIPKSERARREVRRIPVQTS
jgi:HSP20 family protein